MNADDDNDFREQEHYAHVHRRLRDDDADDRRDPRPRSETPPPGRLRPQTGEDHR